MTTQPPDNTDSAIRAIIGDEDWKYTEQPHQIQALIQAAANEARREELESIMRNAKAASYGPRDDFANEIFMELERRLAALTQTDQEGEAE